MKTFQDRLFECGQDELILRQQFENIIEEINVRTDYIFDMLDHTKDRNILIYCVDELDKYSKTMENLNEKYNKLIG